MQLFSAHKQWKTRPKDERFQTLSAMHDACLSYKNQAAEAVTAYRDIRVESASEELALVGKSGKIGRAHV